MAPALLTALIGVAGVVVGGVVSLFDGCVRRVRRARRARTQPPRQRIVLATEEHDPGHIGGGGGGDTDDDMQIELDASASSGDTSALANSMVPPRVTV